MVLTGALIIMVIIIIDHTITTDIITITITDLIEALTTIEVTEQQQLLEEAIQLDAEELLHQDAHLMFIEEAVTEPIEVLETHALQEIQEGTIQEPIDLTTEI